ncbi:nitrite reductase [[Clostridium] dakarense]|uniref:nitrite reductase n=1 Tax=Faecalimicrobium dakarense TaxID=1301100 RepID=UPI0004BB1D8C|nr:nitrite reductase [[Clostridium] dakarense]
MTKYSRLQKDINGKKRYTISPYIEAGFITPDNLIKIGEIAKKYGGGLRINSTQNISIINLKEEDLESVWKELDMKPVIRHKYALKNIEICSSNFCRMSKYPSIGLGMKITRQFYGIELPGKAKIGVSGCKNSCISAYSKDIGVVVDGNGKLFITVGGIAGLNPRSANILVENINEDEALETVKNILSYYNKYGKSGEKLGNLIARLGIEKLKKELLSK